MVVIAGMPLTAQYFQQRVDHAIVVTLDTRRHMLHGQWEMTYSNNAPDTLHLIYMHLYPNAYSSKLTAFARQQLRLGSTDFHYAQSWEMGRIDSLDFQAPGRPLDWTLHEDHPDIAIIRLSDPLPPGRSISISSPFRVVIPRAFSRLGRIEDTYQITQWYPKPAVYDRDGWHAMPYLSQGEFYSGFGNIDVRITAPSNYIIAATGTLHSEAELRWIDSLANVRNAPLTVSPGTASEMRTWHYRAEDVHDFAWFADKRFAVRRDTAIIGGAVVECRAFFTDFERDLWENATGYIRDALHFYSAEVGPYPYPQMSAVHAPVGMDFCMEYPMITVINRADDAQSLDAVITHETGHNWFYGVLASNERDHPWMDEGINSYYDYLYQRRKYRQWTEHVLPWKPAAPLALSDEQRILQQLTREKRLTAPDTDPEYIGEIQNFFGAYYKPAQAFLMLRTYMGTAFNDAMREYYRVWKFRHPTPVDFRAIFEEYCACDLSWLFDGLIGTDRLIDYCITDYTDGKVTMENQGSIRAPIHLIAYRDTMKIAERWYEGFYGSASFPFDITGADRIQVYEDIYTLDATPANNRLFLQGSATRRYYLRVRMTGGKHYPGEQYLNVLPVIGGNVADGALLGVALSNTYWPPGPLQWGAVPLFSTRTKSLTGVGELQYRLLTKHRTDFTFGLGVKSFHYDRDDHYDFSDRYYKVAPRFRMYFGHRASPEPVDQWLQYRYIHIHQDYGAGLNFDDRIWERRQRSYGVHELQFYRQAMQTPFRNTVQLTLQAGEGFVRVSGDLRRKIIFRNPNKALYLRAFAGWLPYYESPKANVVFNFNGIQSTGFFSRDFLYDELLFARNARTGVLSQFIFHKDAGLKTLYNGGISDRWMVAAGIATDTPLPLPVQPYFDLAVLPDPFDDGTILSYSGGLAIVFAKDICEIYIPVIESRDIRNSLTYLERDTFFKRISILLNLKALHPFGFTGYGVGN